MDVVGKAGCQLDRLMERLKKYVLTNPHLKRESAALLQEALIRGEFERGEVGRITGLPERTARRVLNDVLNVGLLASEPPKKERPPFGGRSRVSRDAILKDPTLHPNPWADWKA
jgi:hypothetical protein